jgi:hypothetical protein
LADGFEVVDCVAISQSSQDGVFFGSPVVRNDEEDVLADGFRRRVSEHALGASVP